MSVCHRCTAVPAGVTAVLSSLAARPRQLVVYRLLYGTAVGLSLHAAPAYIAETVPAGVRGAMISLKEAALVAGLLLGNLVRSAFGLTGYGMAWLGLP